jgi:hypothetical protein
VLESALGVFGFGEVKIRPSPAWLGLKLVKRLPQALTKRYQVMILVDTAFGTVDFLHGIRKLKYHAIAGVRCDRQLIDGRSICDLCKRGQQVRLVGLKFPVCVSWYYLKRDNGKLEKRFVLSTKQLKASTITWWGRRRWQIEGWFKTAKYRFGLHRFGQARSQLPPLSLPEVPLPSRLEISACLVTLTS